MASHSQTSSQADVDYYNYYSSHSASSSLSAGAVAFPAPPTPSNPTFAPQETSRKPTGSLAHISVPSFSQFRSQVSNIPSPTGTNRKQLPLQSRPVSNSLTEKASPRLVNPTSRPYSLDYPPHLQSTGADNASPSPLAEKYTTRQPEQSVYNPGCAKQIS